MMANSTESQPSPRWVELALAVAAALVCILVTFWFWMAIAAYQPLLPFPGLYLFEMAALSVIAAVSVLRGQADQSAAQSAAVWVAVGVVGAFAALGAWSIGLAYVPVVLLFLASGVAADIRKPRALPTHLGVALLAAAAQVALMLAVIELLASSAVF